MSQTLDPSIPVTLTWVTQEDERVCPICRALDGKQWFITDSILDEHVLMDEAFGPVYNLDSDTPLAHSHVGTANCRCFLEAEADLETPTQQMLADYEGGTKKLTDMQQFRQHLREARQEMGDLRWQILEVNLVFTDFRRLAKLFGLSPEAQAMIETLQRVQSVGMATVNTLYLLRAAQLGAGPIGWLMFGTAAISTIAMGANLVAETG